MTGTETHVLPPLPETVSTTLGPIKVVLVTELKDEKGKPLFGQWDAWSREIHIRSGMDPTTSWLTLWHEHAHAVLWECGVEISERAEEHVADAMALARVAEMRG